MNMKHFHKGNDLPYKRQLGEEFGGNMILELETIEGVSSVISAPVISQIYVRTKLK